LEHRGFEVSTGSSDRGLARPMLEKVDAIYGGLFDRRRLQQE
jgi:hypothetical protein